MDSITSRQNEKVKLVVALQTRARTRRQERKMALEGTRLVRDAVERNQLPLFLLYEPQSADRDLIAQLENRQVMLLPVSAAVMAHISDTAQPQGIVGVFPLPTPALPDPPTRVLILDNVRDPGNLGTILRTAAAANAQVVLLSPGCADPYSPKTLRSGMGAHFRIPIVEATWEQIADYCGSLRVYLATGDGEMRYDQADWQSGWAVVIGNEAHGASPEAERITTTRIVIPMAAETESLNAAVAAGVILFEALRQRG